MIKINLFSVSNRLIEEERLMVKFLLWLILFVLCWPLALLALILYPLIWLLLLPFIGITVSTILDLFKALITLPARLLRSIGSK